jgi:hypothetical protein
MIRRLRTLRRYRFTRLRRTRLTDRAHHQLLPDVLLAHVEIELRELLTGALGEHHSRSLRDANAELSLGVGSALPDGLL